MIIKMMIMCAADYNNDHHDEDGDNDDHDDGDNVCCGLKQRSSRLWW